MQDVGANQVHSTRVSVY